MSHPSSIKTVAILGLGEMGTAFATRAFKKGHRVTTWNRTPGRSKDANIPESPNAISAAEDVDIAMIIVSDAVAVNSVCSDEFLAALNQKTVLCITSTVSPSTVRSIAKRRPGNYILDCCVMGSPAAIVDGKGRFLVGGAKAVVEQVAPLLADLGAGYMHCGELGLGGVMKITSNLQLMIGVTALAEAVAIARSHGVDDEIIKQVNENSLVTSESTRLRLASVMDPKHPGWFPPRLAVKDVSLALDLSEEMGLSTQVATATASALKALDGQDWEDFAAVLEVISPSCRYF